MTSTTNDPARAKRARLRALLARPQLTVMPGGFSPVYARIAELAGFESFFVAGSQMSAYLLGVPDTGIVGLRDVVDHARHVTARTEIPIFLDLDTGFGNAVNVHFSVEECITVASPVFRSRTRRRRRNRRRSPAGAASRATRPSASTAPRLPRAMHSMRAS